MTSCIVCGNETTRARALSGKFIAAALADLYGEPVTTIPSISDYELRRCPVCTLEFAHPMVPGDNAFYEWIVRHCNYYPKERWGWEMIRRVVSEIAAEKSDGPLTVVDVGCGGGAFVSFLQGVPNLRPIGIDTTESSIIACKKAGLEAYCSDIEDARMLFPAGVDMVTSFHCLEHVSDPVEFMQSIKTLLNGSGRAMITTPYSPMSFEATWYDPLNNPPHHLTRWNERSYAALAKRIGMAVDISLGPTAGLVNRLVRTLLLHAGYAPNSSARRARKLLNFCVYLVAHPHRLLLELYMQAKRPCVNGKVSPDEIMLVFRNI
jgi:2-polyprenyl-3-methyl-5-hydroxy-6-metoxy-1,4-benzoquinol methylase